ncbi:MAG: hypothetical protein ACJ74Q_21435 [Pyrinomonadaceae bacterium]
MSDKAGTEEGAEPGARRVDMRAIVERAHAADRQKRHEGAVATIRHQQRQRERDRGESPFQRKQRQEADERESVLLARQEQRRAELLARERDLVAVVENIQWDSDPEYVALRTIELEALRRILLLLPAPRPTPKSDAWNAERAERLRAEYDDARAELVRIRDEDLPSVEEKLREPLPEDAYKAPSPDRELSTYTAEEATYKRQEALNRTYREAQTAYYEPFREQRAQLVARSAELKREIVRLRRELRELGAEVEG